ncbi:hypothetical protein [Streptococcus pseudoporcinus]|uniref:Uncharacterized protein n=1 Tax=Streptococcus pseudoporcinus TaxID=361101 RepID=A0A4U9XVD7_9STRE|nr:hypothetical protein [Streptococcus pseudoporcinus]VTS16998.1 Uncharacterised protein [Streptococcus pseudoporcinus]VUC68149.1 Uncharacterised protein [Streptococcus pseudoporcinus]VUC99025.1 Uncharacterised protein [Streptococcus pseudoporcinus]VUC99417.1 Uncharacterised protein [Streptococcus pseudoporcinus]
MYYLFRKNNFFIECENGGIFLKNGKGNIKISTPNVYELCKKIIELLDGETDLENSLSSIDNSKLKEFYHYFLKLLIERDFLIYSTKPIILKNLNINERKLIQYINDIDKLNLADESNMKIKLFSPSKYIVKIFNKIFCNSFKNIEIVSTIDNYIEINYFCKGKCLGKWFVYSDNADRIRAAKSLDLPNEVLINIDEKPLEFFRLIFSVIELPILWEINFGLNGYSEKDPFKNKYTLDLKLLQIK